MPYISTGAFDADGFRVPTKKALKEIAAASPAALGFDVTDLFGNWAGQTIEGDNVPQGFTLIVHGPDPYRSRKWVANVVVKADGSLKVS